MATERDQDAFLGNPHTRKLCEEGIKVNLLCKSELSIEQELGIDQIDGGMGIAEQCLQNVRPSCVNCDVYNWKQVMDSNHFYIFTLNVAKTAFCLLVKNRWKTWILSCAAPTATCSTTALSSASRSTG